MYCQKKKSEFVLFKFKFFLPTFKTLMSQFIQVFFPWKLILKNLQCSSFFSPSCTFMTSILNSWFSFFSEYYINSKIIIRMKIIHCSNTEGLQKKLKEICCSGSDISFSSVNRTHEWNFSEEFYKLYFDEVGEERDYIFLSFD